MPYMESSTESLETVPSEKTRASAGGKDRMKVIIVGGSVAGLTLAHCLHHNNIDFVVLEAGAVVAPQVGASIVLCPNGGRILDQLGIFEDVLEMVEPLQNGLTWTDKGNLVINSNAPDLCSVRTGYPMAFLTRRDLLKLISDRLPKESKVLTSKRVRSIDQTKTGVTAVCEDGTEYTGDIIVGADGVHSVVRSAMLKHLEQITPGSTKKDETALSAEYNCIFGFGTAVKAPMVPGDGHRSYKKNYSSLTFVGKEGKLFWFLFSKLDKRYYGKDIPRYTKEDVEEGIKPFFDMHMTDNTTFDEVWENRTFANMVCVEESQFENWTADRFVCLGDAIHKMTPNLGAGGNAAIESAAALANSLALVSEPSQDEIKKALKSYYDKRHPRANAICDVANQLTRIEALDSLAEKFMALYAIPALGDFLADVTCDGMVGAELLDALPAPARAYTATMAWDPEAGVGKKEKKWIRALYALPLLAVVYAAQKTMTPTLAQFLPELRKVTGQLPLPNGDTVDVFGNFFGLKTVDKIMRLFVAVFTPAIGNLDAGSRTQAITFLGDLIPFQTIWMIEGIRRGNFTTAAHLLPTIMGFLYQVKGLGFIAPIYFFLHYIQSPQENYHAADMRMTQMGPVKTIIPTVMLSYVIPSIAMMTASSLSTRQWINGLIWQPFPIYASLLQRLLSKTVQDTTDQDRIHRPEADMPYLRYAYGFSTAAAAIANIYVRLTSPLSLRDVFFKNLSSPTSPLSVVDLITRYLRYDQIATFSAGAIWTMLHFRDLKKADKLKVGWARIVGVFAGTTLVAGPGAAMAVMWAWREEVLARSSRPLAGRKAEITK
ncbi:FAD binding domain-containing protein [Phlyctema vagabunda]|uniref:FAD binding domain-containing protein n=1 Tax=Phlyctema vagabunda TaxID=108571 RepID=A0ABR4PRA3_9HELO